MAKAQKRTDQVVAALMQMTDADSLAAAAVMSIGNREQSLSLLARATAAAPERADLVWLQALRCAQVTSCDPAPIEHRLRELDPTNGTGWWSAMARAGAAHNTEDADAALAAISHSERVDIYWTTLIAHLSRAFAKTKEMSLAESEIAVIGAVAAQAIPPYQYISNSCKGERLQQPGVSEVCRGVAKALQNSDTYITEMIGVAIAKRVWPEDSLYPKLEPRALTHPGEYLTFCAQNRREQDVFVAQLTAAGYDPNPPSSSGPAVPTSM
jgi:hypothetical protein